MLHVPNISTVFCIQRVACYKYFLHSVLRVTFLVFENFQNIKFNKKNYDRRVDIMITVVTFGLVFYPRRDVWLRYLTMRIKCV